MESKSLCDFINEVDSSSPTPGGGSVSALVGVLGTCLVRMYGHLSVHKKKFLSLDEESKTAFLQRFEALERQRILLWEAIEKDCQAYEQLMKGYRMPKETAQEKKERLEAIKKATDVAIDSPYAIMELAIETMKLCQPLIAHGSKQAISDLACGVIFLESALESASLNVRINLASLEEDQRQSWTARIDQLLQVGHQLKEEIVQEVLALL